jgi:hypothetical protein
MGTFLIAAATALFTGAFAYLLGYQRGQSSGRAEAWHWGHDSAVECQCKTKSPKCFMTHFAAAHK